MTVSLIGRSSTFGDAADVTLNNGSQTTILAASATRRAAMIRSAPTNTSNIRLGGSGTVAAAEGLLLQPSETVTLEGSGAIYGWATVASQVVSILTILD